MKDLLPKPLYKRQIRDMEAFKEELGRFLFPGSCYKTVVLENDFSDGECMKFMYSRFLSMTVLVGAIIVKVPQILKILASGSAQGLSYLATILELAACTFTCTYNFAKGFPFSAWGESFFITVQIVVLLLLMFYFNGHMLYFLLLAGIYAGAVWYLTSGLAPMSLLSMLQASVIPLMVVSRMTQIYTTYSEQSTGQLSFITSFLNFGGTASRIFTTIQETQDPIMLVMYISNFILNGAIVLQFILYWNTKPKSKTV